MEKLFLILSSLILNVRQECGANMADAFGVILSMMKEAWTDAVHQKEVLTGQVEYWKKLYENQMEATKQIQLEQYRCNYWTIHINPSLMEDKKIACIKALREIEKLGLVEAKNEVERKIKQEENLIREVLDDSQMMRVLELLLFPGNAFQYSHFSPDQIQVRKVG